MEDPDRPHPPLSNWAVAIVVYLRQHPNAGDTALGITRWWLGASAADCSVVIQALQNLEILHLVSRWTAADGNEHYCAGPALRPPPGPSAV